MPANDKTHGNIINALKKEGWTISREQAHLHIGGRNLWIDIEAEHQANEQIILIEVKSYENIASPIAFLQNIIGQYIMYRLVLKHFAIDTSLFLAISDIAWNTFFQEELSQLVIKEIDLKIMIVNEVDEEIVQWRT